MSETLEQRRTRNRLDQRAGIAALVADEKRLINQWRAAEEKDTDPETAELAAELGIPLACTWPRHNPDTDTLTLFALLRRTDSTQQ